MQRTYVFACADCGRKQEVRAGGAGWATKKLQRLGWRFPMPVNEPEKGRWICASCASVKK